MSDIDTCSLNHEEIRLQHRFCPECGEVLIETCPNCSADCDPTFPICGSCGTNIKNYVDAVGSLRRVLNETSTLSASQVEGDILPILDSMTNYDCLEQYRSTRDKIDTTSISIRNSINALAKLGLMIDPEDHADEAIGGIHPETLSSIVGFRKEPRQLSLYVHPNAVVNRNDSKLLLLLWHFISTGSGELLRDVCSHHYKLSELIDSIMEHKSFLNDLNANIDSSESTLTPILSSSHESIRPYIDMVLDYRLKEKEEWLRRVDSIPTPLFANEMTDSSIENILSQGLYPEHNPNAYRDKRESLLGQLRVECLDEINTLVDNIDINMSWDIIDQSLERSAAGISSVQADLDSIKNAALRNYLASKSAAIAKNWHDSLTVQNRYNIANWDKLNSSLMAVVSDFPDEKDSIYSDFWEEMASLLSGVDWSRSDNSEGIVFTFSRFQYLSDIVLRAPAQFKSRFNAIFEPLTDYYFRFLMFPDADYGETEMAFIGACEEISSHSYDHLPLYLIFDSSIEVVQSNDVLMWHKMHRDNCLKALKCLSKADTSASIRDERDHVRSALVYFTDSQIIQRHEQLSKRINKERRSAFQKRSLIAVSILIVLFAAFKFYESHQYSSLIDSISESSRLNEVTNPKVFSTDIPILSKITNSQWENITTVYTEISIIDKMYTPNELHRWLSERMVLFDRTTGDEQFTSALINNTIYMLKSSIDQTHETFISSSSIEPELYYNYSQLREALDQYQLTEVLTHLDKGRTGLLQPVTKALEGGNYSSVMSFIPRLQHLAVTDLDDYGLSSVEILSQASNSNVLLGKLGTALIHENSILVYSLPQEWKTIVSNDLTIFRDKFRDEATDSDKSVSDQLHNFLHGYNNGEAFIGAINTHFKRFGLWHLQEHYPILLQDFFLNDMSSSLEPVTAAMTLFADQGSDELINLFRMASHLHLLPEPIDNELSLSYLSKLDFDESIKSLIEQLKADDAFDSVKSVAKVKVFEKIRRNLIDGVVETGDWPSLVAEVNRLYQEYNYRFFSEDKDKQWGIIWEQVYNKSANENSLAQLKKGFERHAPNSRFKQYLDWIPQWAHTAGVDDYGEHITLLVPKASRIAKDMEGEFKDDLITLRLIPSGKMIGGARQLDSNARDNESSYPIVIQSGFWMLERPLIAGDTLSFNQYQSLMETINSTLANAKVRFPSESEWEWALSAGGHEYLVSRDEIERITNDPQSKNQWGLTHRGQVWEWCSNHYNHGRGEVKGILRTRRGGMFESRWITKRTSYRGSSHSNLEMPSGVRLIAEDK